MYLRVDNITHLTLMRREVGPEVAMPVQMLPFLNGVAQVVDMLLCKLAEHIMLLPEQVVVVVLRDKAVQLMAAAAEILTVRLLLDHSEIMVARAYLVPEGLVVLLIAYRELQAQHLLEEPVNPITIMVIMVAAAAAQAGMAAAEEAMKVMQVVVVHLTPVLVSALVE
jgi:hypothetical protein